MSAYRQVIGIGGIGTGLLFHSDVESTLGRSESRLMALSGAKDYCKLQIIFYYPAVLLKGRTDVIPLGFVGRDAFGEKLVGEMKGQGMDVSHVETSGTLPTMLSVCIQYPDRDGGNITASNSACGLVTPDYVRAALGGLPVGAGSVAVAAPEVSVEARVAFLQEAKRKGAFCVLSVAESEAEAFLSSGAFADCDLLAVNEGEASALLGESAAPEETAVRLYEKLSAQCPGLKLIVTCGKKGGYTVQNGHPEFVPALPAETRNTTGAGDAFLGGTLSGLVLGLPFQKGSSDPAFGASPLASAAELGALCAGMAVEDEDSIALGVTRESILARCRGLGCAGPLLSALQEAENNV